MLEQMSLLDSTVLPPEPASSLARHTCHAKGCDRAIAPRFLMCPQHWRLVPKPLQKAIWEAYRPGQEIDKQPSAAYLKVAKAAIEAVSDRERVHVPAEDVSEAAESPQSNGPVGRVVLVCPRLPGVVRLAGEVVEATGRQLPEGYAAINIGILSSLYVCPESRLVSWSGAISLWRRRQRQRWNYAGCMSIATRTGKPDCFWFPHGYDPNTRRFEP